MASVLLLVALPFIGFLVGRWWVVPTLPLVLVATITAAALIDNYSGPCTRADGCGAGPVAGAALLSVLYGVLVAALLAAGVLLKQKRSRRTD